MAAAMTETAAAAQAAAAADRKKRRCPEKGGAVSMSAENRPKTQVLSLSEKIGKNSDFLLPKRQKCGILNKHCSEATLNRNLDL